MTDPLADVLGTDALCRVVEESGVFEVWCHWCRFIRPMASLEDASEFYREHMAGPCHRKTAE